MTDVFKLIEANGLTLHGDIEHFAELVRADEREACAQLCESYIWSSRSTAVTVINDCAATIRARGNT